MLAIVLIGFGAFYQFKIQRQAERNLKSGKTFTFNKLSKPLKAEAMVGIALLGVVALLVNSSLPAGEIQTVDAQGITLGFSSTLFSEQAKFDVSVIPLGVGPNTISVLVSNVSGETLPDISGLKIKVSNPQRNIAPIEISITELKSNDGTTRYEGDTTFGFAGTWEIEVEAQRTQTVNESVIFTVLVKPTLSEIRTEITEYDFPRS